MGNQFHQENTVRDCVNINILSLVYQLGHPVVEGDEVGQARPAFHESVLAGPDPLDATHIPCDLSQDDLLHKFPWYRGQADRPVVPQILLTALLVNVNHIGKPPVLWDLSR